ncbi:hypothetical protein DIPPA_10081 [Diplonema papillatum]|nr:hypothetical protein DIPPA_10081 [Diplonema papillatum]
MSGEPTRVDDLRLRLLLRGALEAVGEEAGVVCGAVVQLLDKGLRVVRGLPPGVISRSSDFLSTWADGGRLPAADGQAELLVGIPRLLLSFDKNHEAKRLVVLAAQTFLQGQVDVYRAAYGPVFANHHKKLLLQGLAAIATEEAVVARSRLKIRLFLPPPARAGLRLLPHGCEHVRPAPLPHRMARDRFSFAENPNEYFDEARRAGGGGAAVPLGDALSVSSSTAFPELDEAAQDVLDSLTALLPVEEDPSACAVALAKFVKQYKQPRTAASGLGGGPPVESSPSPPPPPPPPPSDSATSLARRSTARRCPVTDIACVVLDLTQYVASSNDFAKAGSILARYIHLVTPSACEKDHPANGLLPVASSILMRGGYTLPEGLPVLPGVRLDSAVGSGRDAISGELVEDTRRALAKVLRRSQGDAARRLARTELAAGLISRGAAARKHAAAAGRGHSLAGVYRAGWVIHKAAALLCDCGLVVTRQGAQQHVERDARAVRSGVPKAWRTPGRDLFSDAARSLRKALAAPGPEERPLPPELSDATSLLLDRVTPALELLAGSGGGGVPGRAARSAAAFDAAQTRSQQLAPARVGASGGAGSPRAGNQLGADPVETTIDGEPQRFGEPVFPPSEADALMQEQGMHLDNAASPAANPSGAGGPSRVIAGGEPQPAADDRGHAASDHFGSGPPSTIADGGPRRTGAPAAFASGAGSPPGENRAAAASPAADPFRACHASGAAVGEAQRTEDPAAFVSGAAGSPPGEHRADAASPAVEPFGACHAEAAADGVDGGPAGSASGAGVQNRGEGSPGGAKRRRTGEAGFVDGVNRHRGMRQITEGLVRAAVAWCAAPLRDQLLDHPPPDLLPAVASLLVRVEQLLQGAGFSVASGAASAILEPSAQLWSVSPGAAALPPDTAACAAVSQSIACTLRTLVFARAFRLCTVDAPLAADAVYLLCDRCEAPLAASAAALLLSCEGGAPPPLCAAFVAALDALGRSATARAVEALPPSHIDRDTFLVVPSTRSTPVISALWHLDQSRDLSDVLLRLSDPVHLAKAVPADAPSFIAAIASFELRRLLGAVASSTYLSCRQETLTPKNGMPRALLRELASRSTAGARLAAAVHGGPGRGVTGHRVFPPALGRSATARAVEALPPSHIDRDTFLVVPSTRSTPVISALWHLDQSRDLSDVLLRLSDPVHLAKGVPADAPSFIAAIASFELRRLLGWRPEARRGLASLPLYTVARAAVSPGIAYFLRTLVFARASRLCTVDAPLAADAVYLLSDRCEAPLAASAAALLLSCEGGAPPPLCAAFVAALDALGRSATARAVESLPPSHIDRDTFLVVPTSARCGTWTKAGTSPTSSFASRILFTSRKRCRQTRRHSSQPSRRSSFAACWGVRAEKRAFMHSARGLSPLRPI